MPCEQGENARTLKDVLGCTQFLDVLSNLNEALVIVNDKLEIIYCNEPAAKLFKLDSPHERDCEADSLNNQIPALIPNKLDNPELGAERKLKKAVHLMTLKDGEEKWLESETFRLTDGENRELGFAIVIWDVTEDWEKLEEREYYKALKIEADLAADNAWNQVQMLLEFIDAPFLLLDAEFRLTYVNKAAEEALGKSRHKLLNQDIKCAIPKIEDTNLYDFLVRGKTISQFKEYFAPLGMWIEGSIYAWKDNNNNNNIGVYFRNVTENVLLERQIGESEEKYRQLVNSIHDPFFALDRKLRVKYWNEDLEKITKIPSQQALFRHIRELLPESAGQLDKVFLEVLDSKNPKKSELKLLLNNREEIFEVYVYPSANGLSVLCRDVTENRRLEAELKKYNEHLQQIVEERTRELKEAERLATIGQTAGMVGHDIRNPLQAITSSLYLANEETKNVQDRETKAQLTENLKTIEEQVTYINKIVTDLQDFARRLTPTLEEVDVAETLRTILSTIQVPHQVQITCKVESTMHELKTDRSFITRILTNLINNAIQAMPNVGGQITINAKLKNNKAALSVEDNGSGIPEECKSKLFTPLFTTKAKGQGFGLAAVKRLTEALGGTVSFQSEAGKGTKFTVEIPVN